MERDGHVSIARWAVVPLLLAALGAALFWAGPGPAASARAVENGSCDPARPHEAGASDRTIDSGGLTREYVLHVPASYSGDEAVPLLFNFHGFTSNPFQQDLFSELPAKAEEVGFILVTPEGTPTEEGGPLHWNSRALPAPEPDDVGFVDELLTALSSELCIDDQRVFSTGLSNGAGMSSQLACSLSDRIAAIAPVAGASFFESCSPRPVPVVSFHGTEDLLISVGPIEEIVIPAWAEHNGCETTTEQDPVPGTVGVRLVRSEDCEDDATVELYVIFDADPETPGEQGGGHTWPASTLVLPPDFEALLGLITPEISANDLMWDFFMAHPMPLVQPAATLTPTQTAPLPQPTATALPALPTTGNGGSSGGADFAGWLTAAIAGALAFLGAAWYARRRWLHRAFNTLGPRFKPRTELKLCPYFQ